MAIELTEQAAKQIQNQLAKRGKGLALRLGVRQVGCSGYAYTYDFADDVSESDHLFEGHNARVVVDAASLVFVDGSRLDFVKDGLSQMYKVENPNVDSTCGCGESFNLKVT